MSRMRAARPLILGLLAGLSVAAPFAAAIDAPFGSSLVSEAFPAPAPETPAGARETRRVVGDAELVSPFGVFPDEGRAAPTKWSGPVRGMPTIDDPYQAFLERAMSDQNLDAARLTGYAADYYAALGFGTPGSSAATFEENSSVSFTYNLGDLDGDGLGDFALDQYCTVIDTCRPATRTNILQPKSYLDALQCRWPHLIEVVSGADGVRIWNQSLEPNPPETGYAGCILDFVVGAVPDPTSGTSDLLVYRWHMTDASVIFRWALVIEHTLTLLDGETGKPLWVKQYSGSWVEVIHPEAWLLLGSGGDLPLISAQNLFINAILQLPAEGGVRTLPATHVPGLLLQGVGFNLTYADSAYAAPVATGDFTLIYSYQPSEWAAGVEPTSGRVLWQRATFEANERVAGSPVQVPDHPGPAVPFGNRSVFPLAMRVHPYVHNRCLYDSSIRCPPREAQWLFMQSPGRAANRYWNGQTCCFDLTGDGVPDLVYTVYEWSSTPATNSEGPDIMAGRIVALDGATGNTIYSFYVDDSVDHGYAQAPDRGAYRIGVSALGDVDADGIADYFLHRRVLELDYRYDLMAVSGATGRVLWNHTHARELQVQPLGDATGDGSVDFALFDYTFDASFYTTDYSRANVTFTPLSVHNGADFALLWKKDTFMSPADLAQIFNGFRLNGIPDFDQDGSGDILLDDPLFLPDLSTIHRHALVSGKDGSTLYQFVVAGTFSFPTLIGDVNADGGDDFYLLSGDINDLWGTTYDGKNGTALWSRRIMTPRLSNYVSAAPNLRIHPLQLNGSATQDYLLDFHLTVTNINVNAFFGLTAVTTVRPQIVRYGGLNGTAMWALPSLWDQNLTVVVPGASPASQQYVGASAYDAAIDDAPDKTIAVPIQVTAGIASFGAAFAASFLLSRRARP